MKKIIAAIIILVVLIITLLLVAPSFATTGMQISWSSITFSIGFLAGIIIAILYLKRKEVGIAAGRLRNWLHKTARPEPWKKPRKK